MLEDFLRFPNFNPIALSLGPLQIHWYAIAYVVSILAGWQYMRLFVKKRGLAGITPKDVDDLVTALIMGIILGGRLGYVIFYNPTHYMTHPLEILMTWQGGMSFHGGVIGVMIAFLILARRRHLPFLSLMDLAAMAVPIGIYLGRLGNFVNGELYGRITDVPWAVLFPKGGYLPRHPSQIYEATLEGAGLFIILAYYAWRTPAMKHPGKVTGMGCICYAIARGISELYREPDTLSGLYFSFITKGQLLSVPFLIIGFYLVFRKPHAD